MPPVHLFEPATLSFAIKPCTDFADGFRTRLLRVIVMALITCKRCKKIIDSKAGSCPYCGEADPRATQEEPGPGQGSFRYAGIGFLVLLLLLVLVYLWSSRSDVHDGVTPDQASGSGAAVSPVSPSCQTSECPAGTKAVTYSTQQEPFYLCKSSELSEYANLVLGVMIKQARYAEVAPAISGKTGEPAAEGDDKLLLDKYRAKAGVSTFEEAISKCYKGRRDMKVVVLYSPADSGSIYVAAEEDQENKLWLPKASLFRQ
jgi:hypothetical protein